MLPLIGTLTGSGRTTEEIRGIITERLKERIDGGIEVIVAVEEYRPVYMDGDVVKPGAYPYRPGMTVSIAVALAGGRQSVRSSGTLLDLSRELEQFDLLLDTHRLNAAREARLLAEFAGEEDVVFPEDLEGNASSSARVRVILDNERAIMQSRATLHALEADSLQGRIDGFEKVIGELESQKQSIAMRREIYDKQLMDIEALANTGVVPRANLLSLQIASTTLDQEARQADISIIQSRQTLDELRAQLANLPIERQATLTAEIQTIQDSLSRSQIQFDQSIKRLAVLKTQTPLEEEPGFMEPPRRVSISRVVGPFGGPSAALEAGWSSPVLPGDVIWIPYPDFSLSDSFTGSLPTRVPSSKN
jgi:hypothetical protein